MDNMWKTLASWLLLVGIIIAVIVGLIFGYNTTWQANYNTPVGALLAFIGFIVGVLSFVAIGTITHEKVPMFLIGTLILVLLGATASTWTHAWGNILAVYITNIVTYLAIFAAPAAVLLAVRLLWDAGKSKDLLPKMTK